MLLKARTYLSLLLAFAFFIIGCNPGGTTKEQNEAGGASSANISLERREVKTAPVANYSEKLDDDLNDWHFTVTLHETKQRFNYLVNMQYQEMTGADTIRFPNFGIEPQPKIQKGTNPHECIIGFLDKEGTFRDYIKVSVENDQLKIKTLKHYAVYEK